jgi:hypothetical protein
VTCGSSRCLNNITKFNIAKSAEINEIENIVVVMNDTSL